MFDNENEVSQMDANASEESSLPQESSNSEQLESANETVESQKQPEVPFHEHPRFKELIEYKKQSEERLANYERQMQQVQSQYQEALKAREPAKQKHPFLENIAKVDPAFGEYFESLESRAAKAEALEQRIQQFETKQFQERAVNTVNSLHEQNKVSPELRDFYNAQLIAAESQGRIRGIDDIQKVYREVHEGISKVLEARDRTTRASYVTDKSKDASNPTSQPKGKAPARNERGQFTGDREHDMALIAKRALKISKAETDL